MINTKCDQNHIERIKSLMVVISNSVYQHLDSNGTSPLMLQWAMIIHRLQPHISTRITSDEWRGRFNRLILDSIQHLPRNMPMEESPLLQLYHLNNMLRRACIARRISANTEG